MEPPIKARAHGLIDYGFAGLTLGLPSVIGLRGSARALPAALGVGQGALNALTDTPVGLRRVASLRDHGWAEVATLPLFALVVWRAGALAEQRERAYFGTLGALLATVYALTDWDAKADS